MAQGYRRKEVALPMFILLKPEAEAKEAPWERAELIAQERQHRKAMAPHADDPK